MSLFKIHCINKTREQFNVFQHYFIIMVPSMQIKGILNVLLTVNHTVVFLDTFQCLPLPYHFYNREYCCWMIICESMKSQAILHVWPSGYGENNFFLNIYFMKMAAQIPLGAYLSHICQLLTVTKSMWKILRICYSLSRCTDFW